MDADAVLIVDGELVDRVQPIIEARGLASDEPIEPAEGNAANLNLFLHACEKDGSALKFGRSGSYQLYHEVPNYIFTLTGGIRSDWSRARRDPGFQLLHEADVRSDVGTQYEIVVTCVERRLGAGAVRQVPDRGPIGLGAAVDRGQRVGLP
jgi:hypothetical protein